MNPTTSDKTPFRSTVLVTGGGGFLGSAIIERLVARGDAVRSLSRGDYPNLTNMGVDQVRGDIGDRQIVETACRGVELVFHVAAKPPPWGKYRDYYKTNVSGTQYGVLTDKVGVLSNDFFVNLLDMETKWQPSETEGVLAGFDRTSQQQKWTATVVDLVFGSNSQLRAIAEVYASQDSNRVFIRDFIKAWNKVMNNDLN